MTGARPIGLPGVNSVVMDPDVGGLQSVSGGGPDGGVTPAGEGFARTREKPSHQRVARAANQATVSARPAAMSWLGA